MSRILNRVRVHTVATTLLLLTCVAAQANAEDPPLESQLGTLGGQIAAALRGAGLQTALLEVRGSAGLPSSGPAMIQEVLAKTLTSRGVRVAKFKADLKVVVELKVQEIKGQAQFGERPQTEKIVLQLDVDFLDKENNRLPRLVKKIGVIDIIDLAEISRVLGLPFESHPGTMSPNDVGVVEGYTSPQQVVVGSSIIRAAADGKFGIELLVNGKPKAASRDSGFAVVNLTREDRCEIRLINDADYEVAVQLMLDGIDSFWFSDKKAALWLVPPRSSRVIRGWQRTNQEALRFRIVPYSQSVAAKLGQTGSVGVIAATFRRAYGPGEEVPAIDRAGSFKRVGVGRGESIVNPISFVERQYGKVRATVPVRYEKSNAVRNDVANRGILGTRTGSQP